MNHEALKELAKDDTGLATYVYLANNIDSIDDDMPTVVDSMIHADSTGQFSVSAARYLAAISLERFRPYIDTLVEAAIDKDREHRYIADLLPSIWGEDYEAHADELILADNNFRRIYKRLTVPQSGI